MKYFPIVPVLALLLSSCNLAPDYQKPDMATSAWRGEAMREDAVLPADFWNQFGNPELRALVQEALRANYDLSAALHRLEQARASAQVTGSALWPTVDATGSVSHNQSSSIHGASTAQTPYRAGLQAGYELDLFGRNRAETHAAFFAAEASNYDKEALALVVASDTAQAFIGLLAVSDRIQVSRDNLANAQAVLKITQARFDAGTLSALELAQQKTAAANVQAATAALIQQREAQLDLLAVLLGKPPQDFSVESTGLSAFTAPSLTPLQPASLLLRRPDIRAAEARLQAANYDIGAARAAFFPDFQLSASSALSASSLSAPAALANALAAAISTPVFRGGALTGGLELTKARRAEAEDQYRKAVLTSFQEVQDALAAVQNADMRVKQFAIAARESQTAYALARQRFNAGTIDFTTLLDTQRSLFSAQDAAISARQAQLNAVIDLYRALGGGWKQPQAE